jgi:hypothetical protein
MLYTYSIGKPATFTWHSIPGVVTCDKQVGHIYPPRRLYGGHSIVAFVNAERIPMNGSVTHSDNHEDLVQGQRTGEGVAPMLGGNIDKGPVQNFFKTR